jgi:hypothetical protein
LTNPARDSPHARQEQIEVWSRYDNAAAAEDLGGDRVD